MKPLFAILLLLLFLNPVAAQHWLQKGNTIYGMYSGDMAGAAVSLNQDGTIIAVGSPGNDLYSGMVTVYQLNNGQWTKLGENINGRSNYNYFGSALKLSKDGQTLIAGSATDHDLNGKWCGSVKIFSWDGTIWNQKGKTIYGDADGGYFGFSLGMSGDGNIIAAISPYNSNKIKAYQWDGNAWQQMGSTIFGENTSGITDGAIDLSSDGKTIILGLPNSNGNGATSGKVKVFSWNDSIWIQKGDNLLGEAAGDRFGHNVKINANGNTIIIGAPLNDSNGSNTGQIKIFDWNGTSWMQKGQAFNGTFPTTSDCCLANFATSIDDSGNSFAYWSVVRSTPFASVVRIFDWDGTQWKQKGSRIPGGNGSNGDVNFMDLSSDCSTIVIGFPYDFDSSDGKTNGRAILYKWDIKISKDEPSSEDIHFFPNPFNDVLFINSNQKIEKLEVFNIYGKVVYSQTSLIDNKLDLRNLVKGVYFFRMYTLKGIVNNKVVKN